MFLNCGEFVEVNVDLLATYLFNDLSKSFTNVLQITKFYKNHKKNSSTPELGKLRAVCRSFFDFLPIFSGKIVAYICGRVVLCGGNLDPHFPKRGLCKKG